MASPIPIIVRRHGTVSYQARAVGQQPAQAGTCGGRAAHGGSEQRVAAILHGGSGSSLVGALFGVPQDVRYARFTHDNTGISRISMDSEGRRLRYLNRIDHVIDSATRS